MLLYYKYFYVKISLLYIFFVYFYKTIKTNYHERIFNSNKLHPQF